MGNNFRNSTSVQIFGSGFDTIYAGNILAHMYSDKVVHPGGLSLMALDYSGYVKGVLCVCVCECVCVCGCVCVDAWVLLLISIFCPTRPPVSTPLSLSLSFIRCMLSSHVCRNASVILACLKIIIYLQHIYPKTKQI